jgi:hypothetical protein
MIKRIVGTAIVLGVPAAAVQVVVTLALDSYPATAIRADEIVGRTVAKRLQDGGMRETCALP